MKKILLIVFTMILAVWVISAQAKKPSTVLPDEMRGLHFSHKLHADNGMECKACHKAEISTTGKDDLLPNHDVCKECHDVAAKDECKKCHTGSMKLSPRITKYSEKFSHQRHIEKAQVECVLCHGDVNLPLPKGSLGHLPPMAECMNCHAQKKMSSECATCHMPKDDLRPRNHKSDWLGRHGASASAEQTSCMVCHKTDDCAKCHNGDAISSPHPRDYVSRHGQDAHLSEMQCGVCHTDRQFCNSCHRDMNVLPKGHFQPGWLNSTGGDHSTAAQFDLENCMACHDSPKAQPVCARCHRK